MLLTKIKEKMLDENLTKDEAISIALSGQYKNIGMAEWAVLQLRQKKLCCDFSYFRECVEFACGRPVLTHEFTDGDRLYAEILGLQQARTLDEIVGMLPQDKVIVIDTPE